MRRLAALAVVAAGAALPGAAGSSPAAGPRTIGTRGAVDSISADGGRVAIRSVLRGSRRNCMYASVWTPATNAVTRFPESSCVEADSNDARHLGLTLAGDRVAWADFEYGNHAYCQGAFTATLARTKPVELPSPCDPGEGVSDSFFHFSGDGPVLAYSTYQACDIQCTDDNGELLPEGEYDIEIRTVYRGEVRLVVSPPDRSFFVGVSRGRLLVFERGRGLVLHRSNGGVLRRFPVAESAFDAAFLSGSNLVLLRGTTLTVYDATSFAKTATWTIRARRVDDVDADLAVYRTGGHVRVIDLANGRDAVVATPKGKLLQAELERTGLVYAFNVARGAKPGRVTFVPLAEVRAALRR